MAISSSNPPTMKPFSALLVVFMTFFLVLAGNKVNSAETLSFNFPKFTPGEPRINLQGDARISSDGYLSLSNHENSVGSIGRALYGTPVQIWDSTTGNVASFVTSFSFEVADYKNYVPADGIVFFIAPTDTQIPPNSGGGSLGVVNANSAFNQFVGVEFDSYVSLPYGDPDYRHIGIDVNSVISLRTVEWNRVSGSLVKVDVIYDSLSGTLSVAVTNENGDISTVAQVVDLRAVLPERVKFGFSATTTNGGREIHSIHSWSFTSTLQTTTNSITEKMNNAASYAWLGRR